jgi:biotin carboxyl carrier protein
MYHATVNNGKTFDVHLDAQGQSAVIDGQSIQLDLIGGEGKFHILWNNKSFNAELVSLHAEEKTITIKVNSNVYTVKLKDRFDDLLKSLGMEGAGSKRIKDVKAPMPGMVLNIMVNEGDEVTKDQPIVLLEAMKMENVIKSPADGKIKKVSVTKGVAVEKNTILVEFA